MKNLKKRLKLVFAQVVAGYSLKKDSIHSSMEFIGDNGNYDMFPIAIIDYELNNVELNSLTDEEYGVLNKIAKETGMCCWFSIREKKDGKIVVYDIDAEVEVAMKEGINWLYQGIPSYEK